jgi:hypothetical protein
MQEPDQRGSWISLSLYGLARMQVLAWVFSLFGQALQLAPAEILLPSAEAQEVLSTNVDGSVRP